jgi:phage antirepressor YoqD-like protein
MFMWMLHEVCVIKSRKENIYVNVTEVCVIKSRSVRVKKMFMWMLHEVYVIKSRKKKCLCECYKKFE